MLWPSPCSLSLPHPLPLFVCLPQAALFPLFPSLVAVKIQPSLHHLPSSFLHGFAVFVSSETAEQAARVITEQCVVPEGSKM